MANGLLLKATEVVGKESDYNIKIFGANTIDGEYIQITHLSKTFKLDNSRTEG